MMEKIITNATPSEQKTSVSIIFEANIHHTACIAFKNAAEQIHRQVFSSIRLVQEHSLQ